MGGAFVWATCEKAYRPSQLRMCAPLPFSLLDTIDVYTFCSTQELMKKNERGPGITGGDGKLPVV